MEDASRVQSSQALPFSDGQVKLGLESTEDVVEIGKEDDVVSGPRGIVLEVEDSVVAALTGLEEVLCMGEVRLVEGSQSSHSIEKVECPPGNPPGWPAGVELVLVVAATGFSVVVEVVVDDLEVVFGGGPPGLVGSWDGCVCAGDPDLVVESATVFGIVVLVDFSADTVGLLVLSSQSTQLPE